MAFACNESKENCGKYFPMNANDGQIDIDFSKIFASRFTRFTSDTCPFISQCKQKSVLQSLIEIQKNRW